MRTLDGKCVYFVIKCIGVGEKVCSICGEVFIHRRGLSSAIAGPSWLSFMTNIRGGPGLHEIGSPPALKSEEFKILGFLSGYFFSLLACMVLCFHCRFGILAYSPALFP